MNNRHFELLVGDNAFHGISHLSQQRARDRSLKDNPSNVENAAQLVRLSLQNGATGFMFSVSETTLSILESLKYDDINPNLYAIIPYAYEYVRLATKVGGIPSLAKQISKQILFSKDILNVAFNAGGLLRVNPSAILKTYLIYELSRIKSATRKDANLKSVLLHEVITDMALALNLDWFFKSYIKFFSKSKTQPGFETRNFPYLIEKFKDWRIDTSKITIIASFNPVGFQMNPSKVKCEAALRDVPNSTVMAMSILAAGYLQPKDVINYIRTLSVLSGVVVGVSRESQSLQTFRLLRENLI